MGLAVGDALGTTLEFKSPGNFTPVSDMTGGGPFGLKPGQWTDDTSMALCLAESLIETGQFDLKDQMDRYVSWAISGHLSSTGTVFDIGETVRKALLEYKKYTGEPLAGSTDPQSAGNGSIMRLAPVPLAFSGDWQLSVEKSGESSRTTHGTKACVDACRYFGGLIAGAANGVPKEELLSPSYCPDKKNLASEIYEVATGSFKQKDPPEIEGLGYVVKSLEAAVWAFYKSNSFEEGALKAVNLGNDADTTGAVHGQIAGAYYGIDGIPSKWRETITSSELILEYADKLYDLSKVIKV